MAYMSFRFVFCAASIQPTLEKLNDELHPESTNRNDRFYPLTY